MTHLQHARVWARFFVEKITHALGRTHINLRFKATDEEVGLLQPQQNTLHNYDSRDYVINTLHNYEKRASFPIPLLRKRYTLHNYERCLL
jgi:hypothetical protein